jgi:RNA polymerase sigma-70 factor (ECF subfamily)
MAPALHPDLTALLNDGRHVRRLARSVARSGDAALDADDLAQEACLMALRSPPGACGNVRGWFATVLHNVARQARRASGRRTARERAHADRTATCSPPADELVARAAAHRAVVDAVLGLDEPYRTAVLLRFFEDLPPRAIATRLGVPVATVHTRLLRALARLRAVLDADSGAGWRALALPLATVPVPLAHLAPILLGAVTVKTKTLAVCAAALAATAILAPILLRGDDVTAAPAQAAPNAAAAAAMPAPQRDAQPAGDGARTALAPSPAAPAATAAAADLARVRGRVVDPEGRPLGELAIAVRSADSVGAPLATSRADGTFEFAIALALGSASPGSAVPGSARRFVVADERFTTVLHADVVPGPDPFALVVAAPAVPLRGHVVGPDGHALAAMVQVVWPDDLRAKLSDNSDSAGPESIAAHTGADGAFALRAAAVQGAELWTTAPGHRPDRRALPQLPDRALRIELQVPTPAPGTVQGHVADQLGTPQPGAQVALGRNLAHADAHGDFVVDDDGKAGALLAVVAHHRAAQLPRSANGFPPFVLLTVGPAPLQIRGRVVDADGKPQGGVRVWIADATPFARDEAPLTVEGLAQGASTVRELLQRLGERKAADPESALRQTPTASWPWALTDAAGAFLLDGLEDRTYTVRAMFDRTLLTVDVPGVAAGASDLVIAVPRDAVFDRLAGRVVDHGGQPVAAVRVRAQCDAIAVGHSTMHARAEAEATTDEHGRFELRDVPRQFAYLRLDGSAILPLEYGRGNAAGLNGLCGGDPAHVELVVAARRHVQVELTDASAADTLSVLDRDDRVLIVNVFAGQSRRETADLQFADGRTPVFVVPDTAATIVLHKNGTVVRRVPVQLAAGDVNRLRL